MRSKNIPFSLQQREHQIKWRKDNISSPKPGKQNGDYYKHIIPKNIWHESIWEEIRTDLNEYLKENNIQMHTGTHNLLSSWVLCANLYFPIRTDSNLRLLMTEFLKVKVSDQITEITDVELEFAFPAGDPCHPTLLLGEMDGSRGSGQTSPDVAFKVNTKSGKGIVLTECKFTEHSFYKCSARRTKDNTARKGNPDPGRCLIPAYNYNYSNICHQTVWERKYWDIVKLSQKGEENLLRCPAATAGYQLFRQQALAEGILMNSDLTFVASTVAFDNRNIDLKRCLRGTGIPDFQSDWQSMFNGESIFKTWTHQEWINFARTNSDAEIFGNWFEYISNRYKY